MYWAVLLVLLTPVYTFALSSPSARAADVSANNRPLIDERVADLQQPPSPVHSLPAESTPGTSPEEMRKTEITADTKKLYQLALDLRTEVAKSYKDTLSLTVIKKAQEVEQLARTLKILMREEAAAEAR